MKILRIILLFLLLMAIITCNDYDYYNPFIPNYWGKVDANLNGNVWHAVPYCRRSSWDHSRMTISMDRRNSYGELRESLDIFNVPKLEGSHKITATTSSPKPTEIGALLSTLLDDGDVFGDLFRYDSTLGSSFIQIIKWDSINGLICGSFDINLLRSNLNRPNLDYKDTLNISGIF